MLAVGTKAPAFMVKDHRGRDVALSDFAGRKVVLWFFPKADTPG
jgi:peroxiredoxin Q/BCP